MPLKRLFSARSSSGSHFSKGYRDSLVTDESREWKFHDIPVSNDITGASTTDLLCLSVLVLFLLFKNRILLGGSTTATSKSTVKTSVTVSIWVAALAISYRLREVIWIPLLSTILMTRTTYPYLVVLPHCIVACCGYRSEIEQRTKHNRVPPFLSSFGLSFVCHGFGGSIFSDLLMGLPVTALGNARIVTCYLLGYLLTWYAPLDIVYTQWYQEQDKGSLWQMGLILAEAVDTVTTPLGRISRSARELQNKTMAPLVAGMLVGVGGAIIRYGERVIVQGNVAQSMPSLAALQAGVWRTLGYTLLWWYLAVYPCLTTATVAVVGGGKEDHCASYDGSDDLRASIVVSYCIWTVLCQVGLVSRHPFVWFGETVILGIWSFMVDRLHLGPAAGGLVVADEEQKEAKKLN